MIYYFKWYAYVSVTLCCIAASTCTIIMPLTSQQSLLANIVQEVYLVGMF